MPCRTLACGSSLPNIVADGPILRLVRTVDCRHCGTAVAVEACANCGREFALTVAHAEGRARRFEDGPLDLQAADFRVPRCDFCEARARGELAGAVTAGLGQKTCPAGEPWGASASSPLVQTLATEERHRLPPSLRTHYRAFEGRRLEAVRHWRER